MSDSQGTTGGHVRGVMAFEGLGCCKYTLCKMSTIWIRIHGKEIAGASS